MLSLEIRFQLGASSQRSASSMSHLRITLIIMTRDTSKRREGRETEKRERERSCHTCVKTK